LHDLSWYACITSCDEEQESTGADDNKTAQLPQIYLMRACLPRGKQNQVKAMATAPLLYNSLYNPQKMGE